MDPMSVCQSVIHQLHINTVICMYAIHHVPLHCSIQIKHVLLLVKIRQISILALQIQHFVLVTVQLIRRERSSAKQ